MILQLRIENFNPKCKDGIIGIFRDNGHHANNYHLINTDLFINLVMSHFSFIVDENWFEQQIKLQEFNNNYEKIMLMI